MSQSCIYHIFMTKGHLHMTHNGVSADCRLATNIHWPCYCTSQQPVSYKHSLALLLYQIVASQLQTFTGPTIVLVSSRLATNIYWPSCCTSQKLVSYKHLLAQLLYQLVASQLQTFIGPAIVLVSSLLQTFTDQAIVLVSNQLATNIF